MAEVRTIEFWTYGGLRVRSDGTKYHLFLGEKGERYIFTDEAKCTDRNCSVGGEYRVTAVRETTVGKNGEEETALYRAGDPPIEYMGPVANAELRQQLQAEASAARTRMASMARERSDARRDEFAEAMAQLEAIASKLRSRADKNAFICDVIRRLGGVW